MVPEGVSQEWTIGAVFMPCGRRRSLSFEPISTKYINEGCKVEEKAHGSFLEVSEMRCMAPLARHMIQLANLTVC